MLLVSTALKSTLESSLLTLYGVTGRVLPLILVGLRDAEECNDDVADELLDGALVVCYNLANSTQAPAHHAFDFFGVELLCEGGAACEVRKKDCNAFALPFSRFTLLASDWLFELVAAFTAEFEMGRVWLVAGRTDSIQVLTAVATKLGALGILAQKISPFGRAQH